MEPSTSANAIVGPWSGPAPPGAHHRGSWHGPAAGASTSRRNCRKMITWPRSLRSLSSCTSGWAVPCWPRRAGRQRSPTSSWWWC